VILNTVLLNTMFLNTVFLITGALSGHFGASGFPAARPVQPPVDNANP
jgi:hypothetical protein